MDVVLYDTTLRDGSQRAGISFSLGDKVKIAHRLDALGVPFIEGGWPGANPKDEAFFAAMAKEPLRGAELVAFASTCRPGLAPADDPSIRHLLAAGTRWLTIFGKTWDRHAIVALGTTLAENLRVIRETVRYLVSQGRRVIYDAEHFFDGYAHNPEYALQTLRAAAEAGAEWLTLCDTNGGTLPDQVADSVQAVSLALPGVKLGIHGHDDSGLGVAVSLAAVQAGCTMVQGTINGYGERCGNANLCAIVPNLELKMGRPCLPPGRLAELRSVSALVAEVANLPVWDAQPFVGTNAFTHKAGVHASAVAKDPSLYEHIAPAAVGNERNVLVSELAGRSNMLQTFGDLDQATASAAVAQVKALENRGYQFEDAAASLELLVRHAQGQPVHQIDVTSVSVLTRGSANGFGPCEATIKLHVDGEQIHTAADGNGPVNALDTALRKALVALFPSLQRLHLLDYKVRVIEGTDGTGARVRVWIETGDGEQRWGTVGVSENILEASLRALVDSFAYALLPRHSATAAASS